MFFFFNDTATTEIYTLSLHDALPILLGGLAAAQEQQVVVDAVQPAQEAQRVDRARLAAVRAQALRRGLADQDRLRSEEHTSELQSRQYLVCRLLLEKKQNRSIYILLP